MPGNVTIGLVSDIHHGPDFQTKKGTAALELLTDALAAMQREPVDLVVDLGDRITDAERASDLRRMEEVAGVFRQSDLGVAHLLGNHDSDYLAPEDNAQILGVPAESRSIVLGGWRLVFWQANTARFWPDGCMLADADLNWLREELAGSQEPVVVFSHVPLGESAMQGNYYFERNPRFATYNRAAEARQVIEDSGKVVACIAGHVHQSDVSRINGVTYIAMPSLSETSTTHPEPAAAWAVLDLQPDRLRFKVRGLVEEGHEISIPARRFKPVAPLPPYDPAMRRLVPQGAKAAEALAGVRGVLFDLDGVLYRGDEPIPGAREFLGYLASAGIPYAALSNNAQAGPATFAEKLARMGMDFPVERILTSAMAATEQAVSAGFKTVYVVGSKYLRESIVAHGVRMAKKHEPADAVVVGMSMALTMRDLAEAVQRLRENAVLLGTNPDNVLPVSGGVEPECGAIIGFLEAAGGCEALVAGKPNPDFFRLGLNTLGCSAAETLMIGDTLETDILGATRAGIRSAWVATGNKKHTETCVMPAVDVGDLAELRKILDGSV